MFFKDECMERKRQKGKMCKQITKNGKYGIQTEGKYKYCKKSTPGVIIGVMVVGKTIRYFRKGNGRGGIAFGSRFTPAARHGLKTYFSP
jgi:hypothetical protein